MVYADEPFVSQHILVILQVSGAGHHRPPRQMKPGTIAFSLTQYNFIDPDHDKSRGIGNDQVLGLKMI